MVEFPVVRRLRACAVTLAWLVALARPGAADDDVPTGHFRFRTFATSEGLSNLAIASLAQDAHGFLWVGTDDGTYRFDGERFDHFSLGAGLASSAIDVVAAGPDGEICAGGRGGLACWDGSRFSREQIRGLPVVPVRKLVSFAGRLWAGTDGAGLYAQGDDGAFAPVPGWQQALMPSVGALWADEDSVLAGAGSTVYLYFRDGGWRGIGDVGLDGDAVIGVLRDRDGALWIRTTSHVWCLPRGASRAVDQTAGLPTSYDVQGVANALAVGPRGELLVGTDTGFAMREGDRWRLIDRSVGLPAGAGRALLVDREGTLWIGAVGLIQLRGRSVVEYYDLASGLPGNIVWSFRRDPAGTLWVGTNQCLARAVAGSWRCVPGTEGRAVRSFVFPPQGGMFLGGSPSDLLYLDARGTAGSGGEFDRPEPRTILALALGPEGDLWIATSVGLHRLRGAQPGPIERVEIPGVPPNARFASLAVVGNRLWAATDQGIAVLDGGAWHLFGKAAGFLAPAVRRVISRADGRICASYSEAIGVSCFRYQAGAVTGFEHIGPPQGLTSGMTYFLGEDRAQRLWIGTGGGVDVVTERGIDHFDEADGVAGNDAAATAFLLDRDGSVWLGSTGGATHVLAQHYTGPPPPPITTFVDGRLGDRSIGTARSGLAVPHDRNSLILDLATSSMLDPKDIEYEIRLSPTETAWTATRQRQARYAALAPGSYRIEVRARIAAGEWGPASALELTVLPAWWQTRWFIVGCVIAGLVMVGAAFALRQRVVLRRRLRQMHEQSDASFRAVIDLMPDLISVHRDGKPIYSNRALRRLLGGTAAADVESLDRVHPDDRGRLDELFGRLHRADSQPAADVVEVRIRVADGSWRNCELSAVRVEVGGAPTDVISGRDVTERNRLRAKLLVTDRMASLGTLAAGIAHEINNPLAYVTGNLEAAAESLDDPATVPDATAHAELVAAIGDAREGAERVRKIVQSLRSFSRAEDEQRVPVELPAVLESAIRITSNEVRHRARLVRELGPIPRVIGDDGRLTQVFINLVVNAAHAIPEGHTDANRIVVRTLTDAQGRAVVEVEDTGRGMPAEVRARAFDPFFTTKDVGEGTGLGLSICHGIITGLGGQIVVDSAVPRGTIMRVVLPACAEAPAPLPVREPAQVPERPRRFRIMLVDDEVLVAHTLERMLRRDYDITVALCGKDALALIARGERFDAIVSDVMMPNMTGLELIAELERVAPEQAQRLILLSGGAFTPETRERLERSKVPQLEKPVTARELRATLTRVASRAS